MNAKRERVKSWNHVISPKTFKILEENKLESRYCIIKCAGRKKFEVRVADGIQYMVYLDGKFCSFRIWELNCIPCRHAISCIFRMDGLDLENFVDLCYKIPTYMKAYEPIENLINGKKLWPKSARPPIEP